MNAMSGRFSTLLVAAAIVAGTQLGCAPCPETHVSLDELVREYNARASRIAKLWARARITATFPVEGGLPVTWSSGTPNGLLLLFKGPNRLGPSDFVLVGREAGQEVFRAGSNIEQGAYYYWQSFGGHGKAYVGRLELAGAPGVLAMPIDPSQLLAVLGVCELPDDFTRLPAVALTMNAKPGECAYVVTCIDRQPISGRILFKREMFFRWDDRKPRRLYKVNFFDASGRRILTASLENYKPVEMPEGEIADAQPAPMMPTDIRIQWIDPKTHRKTVSVRLELSEMTAAGAGVREATRFDPPPGIPVIRVDRNLRTGGNGS